MLIAASVLTWAVWMSWSRVPDVVDGVVQPQHEMWQMIGAGATLVVLTAVGAVLSRSWWSLVLLPFVMASGFSTAWTVQASQDANADGLYLLGGIVLWWGSWAGLSVVAGVAYGVYAVYEAVTERQRNRRALRPDAAPR